MIKLKDSITLPLLPAFPPNKEDNCNEEKMEQFVNAIIESELEEMKKVRSAIRSSGIRFPCEYKTASGRVAFISEEYNRLKKELTDIKDGILSDVQDSYSIEDSINYIGTNLKNEVLNRNGKYVFRPDSPRFKGDTPMDQILWIAQKLEHYFGAAMNKKGFKTLNPKVGIIYGDGLSTEEIKDSIKHLMVNGYSPETSVYGQGGGLLQKHNRDTQRNAFKGSAHKRNGVWYDVYKDPADKSKASKKGKVETFRDKDGKFFVGLEGEHEPYMNTVFENGVITKEYTFNEVRETAASFLK